MKYETPELTAATPAIDAIQSISGKPNPSASDGSDSYEVVSAYMDWE
jgi:hypothetical protein